MRSSVELGSTSITDAQLLLPQTEHTSKLKTLSSLRFSWILDILEVRIYLAKSKVPPFNLHSNSLPWDPSVPASTVNQIYCRLYLIFVFFQTQIFWFNH